VKINPHGDEGHQDRPGSLVWDRRHGVDSCLIERSHRIQDELDDRLEGELSDRDRLAVTTALSKSILAGFLEGVAEICTNATVLVALPSGQLAKSEGVMIDAVVNLQVKNLEVDEWDELYGED
jgi:hypothetical protein